MSDRPSHRGHCRCGSVVAIVHENPDFSVYCHCDDCRRVTGAPVLASIGVRKSAIVWQSAGTLKRYRNGTASRLFCGTCGSQIAQEHESAADRTFFNTAFMDEPNRFPPTAHTFAGRKLDWLAIHDDLPKHEKTILIAVDETNGTER